MEDAIKLSSRYVYFANKRNSLFKAAQLPMRYTPADIAEARSHDNDMVRSVAHQLPFTDHAAMLDCLEYTIDTLVDRNGIDINGTDLLSESRNEAVARLYSMYSLLYQENLDAIAVHSTLGDDILVYIGNLLLDILLANSVEQIQLTLGRFYNITAFDSLAIMHILSTPDM